MNFGTIFLKKNFQFLTQSYCLYASNAMIINDIACKHVLNNVLSRLIGKFKCVLLYNINGVSKTLSGIILNIIAI